MTLHVALVAAWTLVLAGIAHALRPRRLAEVLRDHGVAPPTVARAMARGMPIAEIAVGLGLLSSFVVGDAAVWTLLTLAGGVLFAMYLGYLVTLVRRGVAVDCGCGPTEDTAGTYTLVRAAVLTAGLLGSSLVGLDGDAGTVAFVGRPLIVVTAAILGLLALTAHAGWAHSERNMREFRHEVAWETAGDQR